VAVLGLVIAFSATRSAASAGQGGGSKSSGSGGSIKLDADDLVGVESAHPAADRLADVAAHECRRDRSRGTSLTGHGRSWHRGSCQGSPANLSTSAWWASLDAPDGTAPRPHNSIETSKGGEITETIDDELVRPRIGILSPRQARAAGAILARSHAEYPSFRHLFPNPERRARALAATFTGIARDAARLGSAYGAVGDDGELHGVAIWLAPGRFPWSAWRQLRGAPWMLSVLRADPASFRAFMKTGANGARLHPAYPHWYLETMGVGPAVQRQGLGGRLLEPVLRIADRDRVDCHLETADPRNADYYARHGFVVENEALQLVPNGPAHIAMRRRPATAPRSAAEHG
jgi:ribosomal protein S18 acetylase RimI-like enzyme